MFNKNKAVTENKSQTDPWTGVACRFSVGAVVSGRVKSFTWAEMVVELEEGVTGRVRLDAAEMKVAVKKIAASDVVAVVIESVDVSGKAIGLRLKEPVASHRNNTIVVGEPGKKLTAAYARGIPNGSDVQICDGVTAIGDRVFFGRALHSVAIPRTVKTIGKAAFRYSKVEAVVMDDGVEFIGENAFADCEKLRFVNLPQTLISVGSRAFLDDFHTHIDVLPVSVREIGDRAFWGVTFDNALRVGDNLSKVGRDAFCQVRCPEVVVSGKLVRIPPHAFAYMKADRVVVEEGVVEIAESAFALYGGPVSLPESLKCDSTSCGVKESVCDGVAVVGRVDGVLSRKEIRDLGLHPDAHVRIQEGVKELSYEAFAKMKFASVSVPGSVLRVTDRCFSGCQVESVAVSEGVEVIGKEAFAGCKRLETVSLPASLKELSFSAFRGCLSLRRIEIPESGAFRVVGNAVVTHDGSRLVGMIPGDNIAIPAGVTSIAPYAFSAIATGSFNVQVPSSVREVCERAFAYACGVESVVFEPAATVRFGPFAFAYNGRLRRVVLPMTTALPGWIFCACESLTEVVLQDGLVEIGKESFSSCRSLKAISLPDSVAKFDDGIFAGCVLLECVSLPNRLVSLGASAFSGCDALTAIEFPWTLENIGKECFKGCTSLRAVVLPDSLKSIGEMSFSGAGIEALKIPMSVSEVGREAFSRCTRLSSAMVPSSLDLKTDDVFGGCELLRTLSSYGVMISTIGAHEFENRQDIETFNVPMDCESIGECAFRGCKNLKSVVISDGVKTIARSAFENCKNLESVRLPESLTIVEESVFAGCANLRSIQIPEGAREIRSSAFSGSGLMSVHIPASVRSIGWRAFFGCNSLATFDVDERNGVFTSEGGLLLADHGKELAIVPGGMKKVTAPASVCRIGSAFNFCGQLEEVELIGDVVEIPRDAFLGCRRLRTCRLSKATRIIGLGAFAECGQLVEVMNLDDVEKIGFGAFRMCGLRAIRIPRRVKNIEASAFMGCRQLSEVSFDQNQDGLEMICEEAFRNCGLSVVKIPDSLKRIEKSAFDGCVQLSEITFGQGLESIGLYAFRKCGVKKILIPSGVTVEDDAFAECTSLESAVADASDKKITKARCFPDCEKLKRIERYGS